MAQLIQTPKGTIEFNVTGTGTPVLFVHGGHSNCEEELFLKGYDPARFQRIVPSRPGYGKTPLTGNETPQQAAELFASLLDVLELETVAVVGISAGGLTAIELAVHFPERVNRLLLVSAISRKWLSPEDTLYKKGKRLFRPSVERFSWALFRGLYAVFPEMMAKTLFRELSTVRPVEMTREDIRELRGMIATQRSRTGFVNDLDQELSGKIIHTVSCPTLIQHSLYDASVNLIHPMHAGEAIRNATVITYRNNWGHLLWLGEDSEQPIRDALDFLEQEAYAATSFRQREERHILTA
jgi:pimeloyl-ACP methyl ester carboxylesterase